MDEVDLTIELGNNGDNAMLLKKEQVTAIYEFAVNRLIMSIAPRDLLITHNWQVAHIIQDPRAENIGKKWICPLPTFDKDLFPFIVTSGRNEFSLVNLKTHSVQTLIKTKAIYHQSQQAAFFK